MSIISISLDEKTKKNLELYMKMNNIKNKSKAVSILINSGFQHEYFSTDFNDIKAKLNRLLYRENMNKKILDQMYVNFGFPKNYDVTRNELLEEFYRKNSNNYY